MKILGVLNYREAKAKAKEMKLLSDDWRYFPEDYDIDGYDGFHISFVGPLVTEKGIRALHTKLLSKEKI